LLSIIFQKLTFIVQVNVNVLISYKMHQNYLIKILPQIQLSYAFQANLAVTCFFSCWQQKITFKMFHYDFYN